MRAREDIPFFRIVRRQIAVNKSWERPAAAYNFYGRWLAGGARGEPRGGAHLPTTLASSTKTDRRLYLSRLFGLLRRY